jgi:hypothetical protein
MPLGKKEMLRGAQHDKTGFFMSSPAIEIQPEVGSRHFF